MTSARALSRETGPRQAIAPANPFMRGAPEQVTAEV
jgi:hypothetical protein